MSYVISINDNEFVNVYGNIIRSGVKFEKEFEVAYITFPVNLGDATIYETYEDANKILKQIKHRKKYIGMGGWKSDKETDLWKIVDNMGISAITVTNVDNELEMSIVTAIEHQYKDKLKTFEDFKERYKVLFRMANPESPFEILPQYALDRDEFIRIYGNISEALMNESWYETSDFKGWYSDDEWYILHKQSGTLINWYKHCGRTNTCNKVLTIKQHEEFAKMILEDMAENNVGGDM